MPIWKGMNQEVGEPTKRYFVLNFNCECGNSWRLGALDIDFIGRFHCPDCGKYNFVIKKVEITKTKAKKLNDAVIVETYRRIN